MFTDMDILFRTWSVEVMIQFFYPDLSLEMDCDFKDPGVGTDL